MAWRSFFILFYFFPFFDKNFMGIFFRPQIFRSFNLQLIRVVIGLKLYLDVNIFKPTFSGPGIPLVLNLVGIEDLDRKFEIKCGKWNKTNLQVYWCWAEQKFEEDIVILQLLDLLTMQNFKFKLMKLFFKNFYVLCFQFFEKTIM